MVTFTSDSASTMLGNQSGVAKQLLEKFKYIFVWQCVNHRLELAISDAVNEFCGVNNFQIFMDKLYSLYS
ncbi:hypothetical protein PR048_013882 [Dryococelus australis]|uniref:DUF4371 domain-containing protein n=1 Tax=Dryococelus australis TaxID=614101 RepID=A0ABQ9HUA5_9NEOP|nr:hypothetical protein PR048_013882 [Dryococelus australis]